MDDIMKICIGGKPVEKNRPRFVRRGKITNVYTDQKKQADEWLYKAKNQIGVMIEKNMPIHLNAEFIFSRPKSHLGTGRNAGILKKSAPKYHTIKPDIDNLVKFALDVLNKHAFHDDSQVVSDISRKRWAVPGEGPHTRINLKTLT